MSVLQLPTSPEDIRKRHRKRIEAVFPKLTVNRVGHHGNVDPPGADALLITFAAHMSGHVLEQGPWLKWIRPSGPAWMASSSASIATLPYNAADYESQPSTRGDHAH
jgi:hypothetical protein